MPSPNPSPHSPPEHSQQSVRQQWLAILSVAVGAFALVTSEFLPVGVLNDVASDLGISAGQAGLMVTLPGIMAALAAPLLSVGIGALDRRYLLIALTLIMIVANAVVAYATDFGLLLFGRVLLGISIGGFWATAIALSGRLAPKGVGVAQATSIIMVGVTLATVLGVPVGTWLSGLMGWRMTFLVTALVGVPVLLAQVLLLPRLNPEKAIRISDLPALFINPQARVGLIAVLLIGLAHFAAYTYVAPFFKHNAGFDGPMIGSLLLLYGVAGVLGNVFAGFAANQSVRYTLMLVALLIGVGTALFPYFATSLTGAAMLIALWGFAFGAFPACASIWMFVVAPKDVERGMPLFVAMFQVIIALGSFFGGRIVDQMGSAVLFSLATALVGCGFVTVLVLGRSVSNRLAAQPS
ncbi:MFS transporter [Pseudomonas mosselii]|uniref:MFS transporter n=2 Tax=Pseudomonas mosselii TaxID=78327 RepID=UPI00083CCAD2|nr:MFS transporter [Pseudomonas mosselii]MBH3312789.1 MFS transporter [Pseudomonas mosselii]MBH3327860.1 MFS transporter [Pseudomonas mosselii]MCL8343146.1 MFS transporter [Pseudomonas mosselii]MCU9528218.1 MFS transporter [Pseudomonas mosselii]MCU9535324.1 MFS transporter [Pseudomonas mosselii]